MLSKFSIAISFLSKLIPLPAKLWLVNNLPLLQKVNRKLIRYRLASTELLRLGSVITRTQRIIDETPRYSGTVRVHIITITPDYEQVKKEDVWIKGDYVENHFISCAELEQGGLEGIFKEFADDDYILIKNMRDKFYGGAINLIQHRVEEGGFPSYVYWDNVFLDEEGGIVGHSFKPGWSPDYFTCYNYIGRSALFKGSMVEDDFYKLAKRDWEVALFALLLRKASLINKEDVMRISEPLQKLVLDSGEVVNKRSELEFEVAKNLISKDVLMSKGHAGIRRIQRKSQEPISSTIIIPTRDGYDILKKCIESIQASDIRAADEILIVDNQSECAKTLSYLDELRQSKLVRVISYDFPFNYSAINNFAVDKTTSDVVILLNNDIEVITNSWLQEMKVHAMRSGVGCVGVKLLYPDNTIQHGGVVLGYGEVADHAFKGELEDAPGYLNRLQTDQNYSAVTAACLAIRRSTYIKVGGMNPKDLTVAFNDVDFCLKVNKRSMRNVWLSNVKLYHHESKTRGFDVSGEGYERFQSEILYMKKVWHTDKFIDHYYNKNLSLLTTNFDVLV